MFDRTTKINKRLEKYLEDERQNLEAIFENANKSKKEIREDLVEELEEAIKEYEEEIKYQKERNHLTDAELKEIDVKDYLPVIYSDPYFTSNKNTKRLLVARNNIDQCVDMEYAKNQRIKALPNKEEIIKTQLAQAQENFMQGEFLQANAQLRYREMDEQEKAQAKTLNDKLLYLWGESNWDDVKEVARRVAKIGVIGAGVISLITGGYLAMDGGTIQEITSTVPALFAMGLVGLPTGLLGVHFTVGTVGGAISRKLDTVRSDTEAKRYVSLLKELMEQDPRWAQAYEQVKQETEALNIEIDEGRGL